MRDHFHPASPSPNANKKETSTNQNSSLPDRNSPATPNSKGDLLADEALQTPAVCSALDRLYEATNSALACDRDPWDFALEMSQLSESGVGSHVLRMMICRTWITHMREVANTNDHRREYEAESDLVLSDRSCFVLTKKGFDVAKELSASRKIYMNDADSNNGFGNSDGDQNSRPRENRADGSANDRSTNQPAPCWDRQKRELRLGKVVVKRFKWPADNQERVLDAFQEEGWPTHIDDPLVPHPKICPKRRLHDTLKCLNRKQENEIIKFRGDGTGQGVLLEIRWDEPDKS